MTTTTTTTTTTMKSSDSNVWGYEGPMKSVFPDRSSEVWGYADHEGGEDGWMGMHPTRQEAIDAGRAYFASDQKDPTDVLEEFWIVSGRKPSPADFVPSVKQITDWMLDNANDEHSCGEAGLDWPRITETAKNEMSGFLRSWALKHAPVTFWTPDGTPERVEMTPSAIEHRDPIPLMAPDGRIFAYACSVCMKVGTAGEMVGVPESDEAAEEDRLMLVEESRIDASGCCVCRDCGVPERGILSSCSACSAKRVEAQRPAREAHEQEEASEAARFAALLEEQIKAWRLPPKSVSPVTAPWPLTIVSGRDGIGYAAFPLEREDVPEDVTERGMAHEWFIANEAAPFGRGDTPEAALDDLRNRAAAILRASIARLEAAEDPDV